VPGVFSRDEKLSRCLKILKTPFGNVFESFWQCFLESYYCILSWIKGRLLKNIFSVRQNFWGECQFKLEANPCQFLSFIALMTSIIIKKMTSCSIKFSCLCVSMLQCNAN
jgi:hypothetical protein